jgi:uracil-DNA glycosylase
MTATMSANTKKAALLELARKRQNDDLADFKGTYRHLREFDCECDHVVPWTISAFNVDADLMLIAQDWSSDEFLMKLNEADRAIQKALGQVPRLDTNKNLAKKVLPWFGLTFADTYATDVFAFVKRGSMTARISVPDLVRCATRYTLPQIAIVRPKMVLCLGSGTFNAVRRAVLEQDANAPSAAVRKRLRLSESWQIATPYHTEFLGIPIFAIAHPGGNGTRASGGEKVTGPRLQALGAFFAKIRQPPT